MTSTHIRAATLSSLLGLACLVGLTACGGNTSSGTDAGGAADQGRSSADSLSNNEVQSAPLSSTAGKSAYADGAATPAHSAADGGASSLLPTRVIKNGDIAITSSDPQQARTKVDVLLARLHGSLDDEQTTYDKQGTIRDSSLVLRVPVASFDTAMTGLQHLGTVVRSTSSGQDVTGQVIDVQQRLRTLRISLHELNSFQSHAANIDQLLRFENAITVRRGQYQSLKAQRNHLLSQTSMSTINLDISVPPTTVAPATHHAETGFLTGLRHGWNAFTGTVLVVLTALGAVLPFAVVLLAIGLPVWWWARRRAGSATPIEAAPAE